MKAKYTLTLEGNEEFLHVKTKKEEICEVIPTGKTTTARIVGTGLNMDIRRALKYLTELEKEGYFTSELATIQNKNNIRNRARIFKRI